MLSGSFGGIELNIDYSDYNEFVKYSSATEVRKLCLQDGIDRII